MWKIHEDIYHKQSSKVKQLHNNVTTLVDNRAFIESASYKAMHIDLL